MNNWSQNELELHLTGAFTWKPPVVKDGTPTLLASRCAHCNETFFPLLKVCPRCLEAPEIITLGDTGTLYTYTVVHVAPKGYATPYVVGYVDMPEGVRLFTQLDVQDLSILRPELTVKASWGQTRVDDQGRPVYSYKFKPASVSEQ